DLGKYADQNVDDIADKVETTLVLDYLLSHNRIHYLVDRWAAAQESGDGKVRYGPYQATWYSAPPKPAMVPEDVGNLEEALANMEAFRQYINPSYAEGVAKLVEGRLDERNVNEWKAFFIGGRVAGGRGEGFFPPPPGGKEIARFLILKTARPGSGGMSLSDRFGTSRAVHGSMLFLVLVWGLAFVAIKQALGYMSWITLTFLRFVVADLLFVGSLAARRQLRPAPSRADLPRLTLLASVGFTGYHLFLNLGETDPTVTAGTAALIIASTPAFIAV